MIDRVLDSILTSLQQAIDERGFATLALAGGTTLTEVVHQLAGALSPEDLAHLHLFWVDERCAPRGSPERNDTATLATWKAAGPLPAFIHSMPAETKDAAGYARTIQEVCGGILDCAVLGIGPDGHLASLFPGHPALAMTDPVLLIKDSPKPPACRLTMSISLLKRCRNLIIVASTKLRKSQLYSVTGPVSNFTSAELYCLED
jgi:6-phosphogluconolactonase